LSGDHEIKVAHRLTALFKHSSKVGVVLGCCRIPDEHFHAPQEFLNHDSQFRGLRQPGNAEAQFRLRDNGNSDLADRYLQQPLSNMREVSPDNIADGIGIQEIADWHLEQPALLWRSILAICEEVFRDLGGLDQCEEISPGFRPSRKDDIAGPRVAPDIDLRSFETILRGQADGLAATVAKELGGLRHGIYHDICRSGVCQSAMPAPKVLGA
jgi:hypothetical protein